MQPDSLIPDPSNPQTFNRFSYVVNNPVNFNDPTGHDPSNNDCDYAGYCGEGKEAGKPLHLNAGGRKAWKTLHEKGLAGNSQEMLKYAISTEFTTAILGAEGSSQGYYLFNAMTRSYYEHCKGGSGTGDCYNNFWGYMQGPLNGSSSTFKAKDLDNAGDMAAAILDLGNAHGNYTANKAWQDGCTKTGGVCHWANVPTMHAVDVLKRWANPDQPYDTTSWSIYSNPLIVDGVETYSGRAIFLFGPQGGSLDSYDYFMILNNAAYSDLYNENHSNVHGG